MERLPKVASGDLEFFFAYVRNESLAVVHDSTTPMSASGCKADVQITKNQGELEAANGQKQSFKNLRNSQVVSTISARHYTIDV